MSNNFERIVESFIGPDGEIKRKVDVTKRNTVESDRWDRQVFDDIITNVKALGSAQDDLLGITNTAAPIIADTFWQMLKVDPEMKPVEEVTPSHAINHFVMEELMGMPDIEKIRFDSVLDTVSSAFGVVDMEPQLEIIFDRLKEQQQQAEQLENDLIALSDGSTMGGEGQGEGEDSGNGSGNAQSNQALAQKAQELLAQAKELDKTLEEKKFEINQSLREGMNEAAENSNLEAQMSDAWGLDAGGLKQLDPDERIELSYKLRTEKFQLLAKLFGPMLRLAIAEQERKVRRVPNEVMDIEQGDDLSKVLLTSMLNYFDPNLKMIFLMELYNKQLLQYAYDGEENVGRGSIILCEDGSGSMSGTREVWAKGVSLALLYIAARQKRDFMGIHFGGTGEHKDFIFNHKENNVEINYKAERETVPRLQGTVKWAETFFGGGTCFMTPLSVALAKLQDEFESKGQVSGDMVFITDGQCGLTEEFVREFNEQKARCGFKVWGILIGTDKSALDVFADEVIYLDEIMDATGGSDISGIFGGV